MRDERSSIEPEARRALVQGAVLAILVYAVPFLRFVLSYLNVIAHELGHTLAGWGFGYPSVPAFDWHYGGGVTLHTTRSTLILLIVYAILGFVIFAIRDYPRQRNLVAGFMVLYSFAAFTPLHDVARLAMGHLMELSIAGIFVYRAITGSAVVDAVERPLYAACGFFIVLHNTSLAWGLMTDADARAAYSAAKGGGHWMDLSQIARDYLGVGLPAVAVLLLLSCLATPWLSYLAHRHGAALTEALLGDGG